MGQENQKRTNLLDHLSGYIHLKTAEVRLMRNGKAYSVPAWARGQVLHIHGALRSLLLNHGVNGAWHGFSQHMIHSYVDRIKELLEHSQERTRRAVFRGKALDNFRCMFGRKALSRERRASE